MPLAAIWISDLAAALAALEPADDGTLRAIAGLLGLERAAAPAGLCAALAATATGPGRWRGRGRPVHGRVRPLTLYRGRTACSHTPGDTPASRSRC